MVETKVKRGGLTLSLAVGELKNNLSFSLWFVFSLALGLTGFMTLDALKGSLAAHLDRGSRDMTGADLGIYAARPFTEAEEAAIHGALPQTSLYRRETTMLTMLSAPSTAPSAGRLVEVRAVDESYPFYGKMQLDHQGDVTEKSPKDITAAPDPGGALPKIWLYPELLVQLGVDFGSTVQLGERRFVVTDVVRHDPAAGGQGFVTAPRVYVGEKALAATGLIARGSRVARALLVKLPPETDVEAAVKLVKDALGKENDASVRSHRQASEEIHRALTHFSSYLGLVALVALFLGAIGAVYLFRSLLEARRRDIAILLSLGLSLKRTRLVYIWQLVLLGAAATVVATVLALLALPLLGWALGSLMPAGVSLALNVTSVALALGIGVGGSLLACWPFLARLGALTPASLFREAAVPALGFSARYGVFWLPAIAAFTGLAALTARSWFIGGLFSGILLVATALFAGAALLLATLLVRLGARPAAPLAVGLAWHALGRQRLATTASFVALSLGALLTALIPNFRAILATELEAPETKDRPSLFLFDIQDEQLEPLRAALATAGHPLADASPMIRARLLDVNGKSSAGDEEDARALRRGYNLSYRSGLQPSEALTAGHVFQPRATEEGPADHPAAISLEARFAERMGLNLGDRLRFDVQGVEVSGEVVNFRQVRWTSFQPNFFIEFAPGALEEAPKTFVASVAHLDAAAKLDAQSLIVQRFPNVSVIDVAETIGRILGLIEQMSQAVVLMAVLAMLAGLTVLYAIARHQAASRLGDVTLLKVLGLSFTKLRWMSVAEFATLGGAAALTGTLASLGASFALSWGLFDRVWVLNLKEPLLLALALATATSLTGYLAVARSLKVSPARLLTAP